MQLAKGYAGCEMAQQVGNGERIRSAIGIVDMILLTKESTAWAEDFDPLRLVPGPKGGSSRVHLPEEKPYRQIAGMNVGFRHHEGISDWTEKTRERVFRELQAL